MASIIEGTDQIVDEWLARSGLDVWGIGQPPHYTHKRTLRRLTNAHISELDCSALIEALLGKISENWQQYKSDDARPSHENWRMTPQQRIDPNNTSPEVILERAITQYVRCWFNNIPTSASILHSNSDSHRKIDLAHKEEDAGLSLFELKVESNTPLSAAIQILRYTLLLMFSRQHAEDLGYSAEGHPMLFETDTIHVRVLAPVEYYTGYASLVSLERCFQEGLRNCVGPYDFDFQFLSFSRDFNWRSTHGYEQQEVQDAVNGIVPLN